jgi:tetratricopeptide (TPR) repeat protein
LGSLKHSAHRIKYVYAHQEIPKMRGEIENLRVAWDTLLEQRRIDWFDRCWESLWLYYNVTSDFREGEALFQRAAQVFDGVSGNAAEKRQGDISHALAASFLLRQGRVPEAHLMLTDPRMNEIRVSTHARDRYLFYFIESYVFHALGDAQCALASAERAFDALPEMDTDPYLSITGHYQMARVQHLLGNPELAHAHLQETMRSFRHDQLGWGEGLVLTELGLVTEARGWLKEALAHYTAVLAAVTEWEEVWNYYRTQISIGRVQLALGRIQEAKATFHVTLQGLIANPQLGLEIDCFAEVALVLNMAGKRDLCLELLEYCAVRPDCFQSARDTATRYLATLRPSQRTPSAAAAIALPANKRQIALMLMDELTQFQLFTPSPSAPDRPI